MSTKFFTNQNNNSLLKKFDGVFSNVPSIRNFDALVGYFRASGYFKVREFLDKIPTIRILVGINVDMLIKKYHDKGQLYIANPDTTKEDFLRDMIKNIQEANYDAETEKGIIQFIDDLASGKLEMRAHPSKKIHAKVYIFRPIPFNEHAPCEVITGSSNLTDSGLGAQPESNYEFNVSLRDYEDVKFATDEFEALWKESVPVLHAEADALRKRTYLKDDFTPFELYIKVLIEYFGKRVEYDPYNIDLLLPNKYMPLKYQSDAANQGYAIMMKHNGFILADVVGLGKTIIACMVIKKFIYENGNQTRILVVVPPAIEPSWLRTVEDFQIKPHIQTITLGKLDQILNEKNTNYSNADQYDLIVVDESHKFRNDYTNMYLNLQEICKRPRIRPSENGDTRKKVILISATPLNNRPEDIENQLYLFQDRRNSTLENIKNLQDYFRPLNKFYQTLSNDLKEPNLSKEEKAKILSKLRELFKNIRDNIIEPLVIRRTRTDIEKDKDYLADLEKQKIKFPKLGDPNAMYYNLNGDLSTLFYETVSMITGLDEEGNSSQGFEYYRYRAIEFLAKEEDKKQYPNAGSISERLSAIMKTLMVKRLESSFFAFKMSLSRFQKAIGNMIEMFDNDKIFIAPDLDINKLLAEGMSYDEIESKINDKKGNNKTYTRSSFDKNYIEFLKDEKAKVDGLVKRWEKINEDPKMDAFLEKVKLVFFNKKNNISGKLVIFTESKETAEELHDHLTEKFKYKVLQISSENRKDKEDVIRDNFDANLEEEKWKNDFDIVVTTEVLAEGINLHRSNVIVNYDVPWNATRLMQRIGRVNRIGTRADEIFVYNFYPSADGDKQIKLVNNALRKLQAFHTAFGEDNRIFSLLEERGEGALYGNKIQKEENEILDFLIELREFKKKNPERFAEISEIPNKARCGRKATKDKEVTISEIETGEIKYPLQSTTLTYLKSQNHPGVFCLVTPENNVIELNFIKAIKIFKSSVNEKALAFHDKHHDQTLKALDFFVTEKNQQNIQSVTRRNIGNVENKAITNLRAVINRAANKEEKAGIQQVLALISAGTFPPKGLPKDINDFFVTNKSQLADPEKFISRLYHELIIQHVVAAAPSTEKNANAGIVNPKIVISESFI